MPLYEYACANCGARTEVIQKFSDAPLVTCSACRADALSRVISAPAITFKGSGWYITDYSAKGRQETTTSARPAEGQTEAASQTGTTNATSDAQPSAQAA